MCCSGALCGTDWTALKMTAVVSNMNSGFSMMAVSGRFNEVNILIFIKCRQRGLSIYLSVYFEP
jgi:hypothetical protein